jgi:hypothetical protein
MKLISEELCQRVPVRPRVAFVLAVAERVLPALAGTRDAYAVAERALTDGWRWEQGQTIPALQLYKDDVAGLAIQGSLLSGHEASAAMCAATSAFYYTLWHAFRQDLDTGQVSEGEVPNDMAEVTEEVIDEVCDCAIRSSVCDRAWITSLAEHLSANFHATNPEDLGPSVPKEYFRVGTRKNSET